MSLLFTRLLHDAEASLAAGVPGDAETACCQVLSGAVALGNAALICNAAELLRRVPTVDEGQRRTSIWHLSNHVSSMQRGTDRAGALRLCDALLLVTENMLYEHLHALDLALYITGGYGMSTERHPDYTKYLDELIRHERGAPEAGTEELPLEQPASGGPDLASRVLATYGTVLVRQLFHPGHLESWRIAGSDFFANDVNQAINIAKIGDPDTLIAGASKAFLSQLLQRFFFFEPKLIAANSFLRRVEAKFRETTVPFHQDVNAFGRLMINVWTPLVACGRDAPGLEVVARRTSLRVATAPADSQYDELQIPEDLVQEQFGAESIFRPEMAPGDVLILLGTTIHRTRATPEMTERRLSLELRFAVE